MKINSIKGAGQNITAQISKNKSGQERKGTLTISKNDLLKGKSEAKKNAKYSGDLGACPTSTETTRLVDKIKKRI